MKCEEAVAEPQPKKLLNEEDVATNWLPDDLDQRRLHLNFGQTCGHEIFGEFFRGCVKEVVSRYPLKKHVFIHTIFIVFF